MQIKIQNKYIFFAVENCWHVLDYRFKTQINSIVSENSDPDTIQQINIDKDSFVTIMNAVNSQPQGVAKEINPEMFDKLKVQVIELASNGDEEAALIAKEMNEILEKNASFLEKKILNGKNQILS